MSYLRARRGPVVVLILAAIVILYFIFLIVFASMQPVPNPKGKPMAMWLFKQEPSCYSLADLERDGSTTWDGVANALARKNLRQCKSGDRVLFYHTGKEKAVVGEMKVVGKPKVDANSDDPNAVVVVVKFVRRLANPVSLSAIKEDTLLAKWDLVRLSRLSVVPVSEEQWERVEELANATA
jgi:predicted RNA-binding protein with PUA-like domain